MGTAFSRREERSQIKEREDSTTQFIVPFNIPLKVQMEYIITYWFRNCDQIIPMEIVQFIINSLLYQQVFAEEHNLKLREGDVFYKELPEALHYNADDPEVPSYKKNCDFTFRFLFIGQYRVGKTSLLLRFADESFTEFSIRTVGVDFRFRTINVDAKVIKLMVWDSPGHERIFSTSYWRNVDGVIMVYDITSRDSFERIQYWNEESKKHGKRGIQKLLIGNKRDLEEQRVITADEGQQLAIALEIPMFEEASAKTGENVEEAIQGLTSRVIHRIQRAETPWIG